MAYDNSNSYGGDRDARRNELDNTTGGYGNSGIGGTRSDDYTSGKTGAVGSGTGGLTGRSDFNDSSRSDNQTNYGSNPGGTRFNDSIAGTTGGYNQSSNTYESSGRNEFGTNDRGTGLDSNTRDAGLGSNTNRDGYGSSNIGTTGGYGSSNVDTIGGYGSNKAGNTGAYGSSSDNNTSTGNYGSTNADNFGTTNQDTYARGIANEGGNYDSTTGHKPTMGEKVKGTMEKMQGKVTKNPELVERGQERKEGNLGNESGNNNY